MIDKSYSHLAEVYEHMMRFIDYKSWAKYIYLISKLNKNKNKYVLELAGGRGTLAKLLQEKFTNYILTDLSLKMLSNPKLELEKKVVCNFFSLPFRQNFDFIFSTFDSVNYILTKRDFIKMLNEVAAILYDDGIFTFDVSLEKNSLKHLKNLNRHGEVNSIKYFQKSQYNIRTRIHTNKFEIILENGSIVEEIHKQKVYLFKDYFDMIEKSPFYVYACYKCFSFDNADEASERAQFVLRKRKLNAYI